MDEMYTMDPFCYDSMGTEITSDSEDMNCGGSEEHDYNMDDFTEPVRKVRKEETKKKIEKDSRVKADKKDAPKTGKKADKKATAASSKKDVEYTKKEKAKKPKVKPSNDKPVSEPLSDLEEVREDVLIEEAYDPVDGMFTNVNKKPLIKDIPQNNPAPTLSFGEVEEDYEDCEITFNEEPEPVIFEAVIKDSTKIENPVSDQEKRTEDRSNIYEPKYFNDKPSSEPAKTSQDTSPDKTKKDITFTIPVTKLPNLKLKEIAIFLAMLFFLIGIPVMLRAVNGNRRTVDRDVVNGYYSSAAVNTEGLRETTEEKEVYEDMIKVSSTKSVYTDLDKNSSRFSTLNDLTDYISAKIRVLYQDEKELVNSYREGDITKAEFKKLIADDIDEVDKLNHLLTSNKQVYLDNDQADIYSALTDEMDELMVYGDKAVYDTTR